MSRLKTTLLAATFLVGSAFAAQADVKVATSIKPVHSLVAAVMEGVGTPGLIVDGAGSPHTYALKPSKARLLENADVVFWIGHELEAFLEKPVETIAAKAQSVELIDAHGLVKLGFREGGPFEKHGHGDHDDHGHGAETKKGRGHAKTAASDHDHDHDHDHHHDHAHDHDHDKDKRAKAGDKHGHEHAKTAGAEHGHAHGQFDSHVWLDPVNAKAMVHEIEEALAKADPANAKTYKANAKAVMAKLDALTTEVAATLKPLKNKGFIVFHDAYQYFENRFGLTASGSITVSPEVMPGAERVAQIRAKVKELGAACVFSEPQFEPKLVSTVTEGTQAKSGVLDPLGSAVENGPDLYFSVIRNMAASIRNCLSESS